MTHETRLVSPYLFGHRGNPFFSNAIKWHIEEVGISAIKIDTLRGQDEIVAELTIYRRLNSCHIFGSQTTVSL